MTPTDITALDLSHHSEPWPEKMAASLGYSASQLWRVVYHGAPVTCRMQREEGASVLRGLKAILSKI